MSPPYIRHNISSIMEARPDLTGLHLADLVHHGGGGQADVTFKTADELSMEDRLVIRTTLFNL